jgi:hypothetical protein
MKENEKRRKLEFRERFENFVEKYYNLLEKEGRAHLFGWYNTEKSKMDVQNYLLTIHVFCWNHMYRKIFGEEDEDYLKKPLEYLLDSLEFDENEEITVPFLPNLLEEKLREGEYESEFIDPMDRIHRIFVSNTEKIVKHTNKRLEKIFEKIDPPWGAVITKEQAERIIERKAERLIHALIVQPAEKHGWDHPEFGVEGGKEAFEKDLPMLRQSFRKFVKEVVNKVYKIKES